MRTPNKVIGVNTSGPRRMALRARWASRVTQFCRSAGSGRCSPKPTLGRFATRTRPSPLCSRTVSFWFAPSALLTRSCRFKLSHRLTPSFIWIPMTARPRRPPQCLNPGAWRHTQSRWGTVWLIAHLGNRSTRVSPVLQAIRLYVRSHRPLCSTWRPTSVVVVTGPRQSGKTTLVRSVASDFEVSWASCPSTPAHCGAASTTEDEPKF